MRKLVVLAAALAVALVGLAIPAQAKMTIKYGHVAPPFHGQSKGVDAFAKYVNEKTNGEIEVKTFPFGQLGSERSMAEQVQAGTLEMASITTAVMQNYVPQTAVMDLPFAFPSRKVAYAVIDDPEWQKKFFGYLPKKGFIGIGWTENEIRDITNTKRPIRKPEDVAGLKIRVMNSPVYMDTFKQLGASPVGIPFPELYSALQQGVIDAQENPLYTSILIKATEITKFATKTQHIVTECIQIVNPDFWEKLKPEQQKIFREAAALALKVNREETAKDFDKLPKLGISIAEYCKQNSVQVVDLTPAERKAFADAVKPVWTKYRDVVGPDLYDAFMATIKKHSK
ncbi:MAG: DctP family TRAP transporter solute-binding subunit [Pseudomonadota bacterium]